MSLRAPSPGPVRTTTYRRLLAGTLGVLTIAAPALIAAQPAHAVSGFTAGDVVVYRVGAGGTGSGALGTSAAPVFLDEYSPSGTLVQSVAMPTAASGANKPLVASGTATSEGLLTLSPDGKYLAATGYDAAPGTSKISSSAAATTPRTVAIVNGGDNVDTSTALTDFADGNNPRSAVTSDGTNIWVGGAAGSLRYTTIGSTTSTAVTSTTYKNVRQVGIVDGQLYTSADPTKASITVATVGTGLPTSGSLTPANLAFATPPTDPYGYALLTLGNSGGPPDTLYEADNASGAVVKYSLAGGTWTSDGSVSVPGVTGVAANDSGGTVTIFASSSNAAGTTGGLSMITDSSGLGGTLTGTATTLATAAANQAFRGIAFAPGTVIGSGGGIKPPPVVPSITPSQTSLPAQLDDPTNPTLGLTVADTAFSADQLTVTATSSNTSVAPQSGIAVTGTGANRTLTLTPGTVGYSTITLTVAAPDGTSTTTSITYGVSAYLGDPSDRYFSGAGNASAAIDVGGGYMILGDDESNVLRLYNETQSGPPVKTFDFTSELPFGTTEIDIEAAARSGNTLYWTGSMSNNSSGNLSPARSTLFAATITGSGANTQLSYLASYTGLQTDLVNWDKSNGHGLGANYFGFDASVNGGVDSHEINALNVEGMEFAGSSSSTAYLAFRAPLEPTSDRHLALVVPVTNIDKLVTGSASAATFGTPLLWDLGGLGIRDIKENAAGQYLIIAGTADGSNSSFVLYTWDGNPADAPQQTNTTLPLIPAGANQGSWETIVSVPDPLSAGDNVQLVEDNGDTAWYGDDATSKDSLPADLAKDLGRVFSYSPPTPNAVTITADDESISFGSPDPTFAYTTSGLSGSDSLTTAPTCGVAGDHSDAGSYPIVCSGAVTSGDNDAISYVSGTLTVTAATPLVQTSADNNPVVTGQPVTFTATVLPPSGSAIPTGSVEFTAGGTDLTGCESVDLDATGAAHCTVSAGFASGAESVVANYSGDGDFAAASAAPLVEQVTPALTATSLSADNPSLVSGQAVTFSAVVVVDAPGTSGPVLPGGSVDFQADGVDLAGCTAVPIDETGTANCAVPAGFPVSSQRITASYTGDDNFGGSLAPALTEPVTSDSTTVDVTASANPPVTGQGVSYDATVLPVGPGSGTPTGSVTFTVTGPKKPALACSAGDVVPLSGGSASCQIAASKLTPGTTYAVAVTYSGDPQFTSSSGSLQQTIAQGATTVTVTSSADPSVSGASVTFDAGVAAASPASGTPTGTVTFSITDTDGSVVACRNADTVKLSSGDARCVVPVGNLAAASGPDSVVATYSGSTAFVSSTGSLSQSLTPAPTLLNLKSSANRTRAGEAVTFTATVKPTPRRVAPLGGSVAFTVTGVSGDTVECDGSGAGSTTAAGSGDFVATCMVAPGVLTLDDGPYQVVAAYSGDANDQPSSATASHTVTKPAKT